MLAGGMIAFSIALPMSMFSESLNGRTESCGHAAARVAVWLLERESKTVPLPDQKVLNLLEIKQGLESVGLATFGARFRDSETLPVGLPAIVPLNRPDDDSGPAHFVVIVRHADGQASMVDYPSTPKLVSLSKLRESGRWDGTALVIASTSEQLRDVAAATRVLSGFAKGAIAVAGLLFLLGLVARKGRRVKKEATDGNLPRG